MIHLSKIQRTGFLFFATLIVYLTGAGLVSMFFPQYLQDTHSQILVSQFFILLLPAIWYARSGENVIEEFRLKPVKLNIVPFLVLGTLFLYPTLSLISSLSGLVLQSKTVSLAETMLTGGIGWNLLIVALVPCLVEEMVCRGMLLSGYRGISSWSGIFLSAFLFGCLHMNLNQFLYTFIFGIFLAYLVEVTGSIFSSMICHFTLNASSVIMTNLYSGQDVEALEEAAANADLLTSYITLAVMAVIGLLLLIPTIRYIIRNCGWGEKNNLSISNEKGKFLSHLKKAISPGLLMAVALCVFYMIMFELQYTV
jgi:uncharacterized protein